MPLGLEALPALVCLCCSGCLDSSDRGLCQSWDPVTTGFNLIQHFPTAQSAQVPW